MSYPIRIASSPCVPYVIGYSLNYTQAMELAPRLCTPEQLSINPPFPEVALNMYMESNNIQEGFLRYKEVVYYLWIKGVLPSFDGKKPAFRIPPVDLERYPGLAGVGDVKPRCIKWPIYYAGLNSTPTLDIKLIVDDVRPSPDEGEDGRSRSSKRNSRRLRRSTWNESVFLVRSISVSIRGDEFIDEEDGL
ncbi:hypothetical protein B0H17DRAFT_1135181 [Mycena rosella]|uniref:Uncharacterized protein n=1 Tax=Mycena rosella TaxID=1033263 RepID=A0AAD7DE21_MYCRO|nr:hypothetical protein B0H17DRAFT_1135181 [Mycena rosella]